MKLTTQTASPAIGCTLNHFEKVIIVSAPAGSIGLFLDGAAGGAAGDVHQNTFDLVVMNIEGTNNKGLVLGFCDFNVFQNVSITCSDPTPTNSYGLYLQGSETNFPASNHFNRLNAGHAGIGMSTADGTPKENTVDYYDTGDGAGTVPDGIGGLAGISQAASGAIAPLVPFGAAGAPALRQQDAQNTLLTSTDQTTIASQTVGRTGNYLILGYLRVTNAATVCTFSVNWKDEDGVTRYHTPINAVSEPVGPVIVDPILLHVTNGSNIFVNVTAGTANQVYASATILAV
jgi:hypothetical protein